MTRQIFTIGHGTKTLAELVAILRAAGVKLVVDVRRFPGSRRHPHFGKESLEASLPPCDIGYEWWGEGLGGRRSRNKDSPARHPAWRVAAFQAYADYMDTDDFRRALERLEVTATDRGPVAIMCSETLWWKCHRRLISDSLALRGARVVHLLGEGKRQDHVVNPSARPDDEGFPIYDVAITSTLDI
ncbi:MAG: DUF488 domain-containing protein [Actinomycetota bacterium]|nr:DUF488 domain-containing protein [Actinomycetota bacterium]